MKASRRRVVDSSTSMSSRDGKLRKLRILILAGRDPFHPHAAGGDLQAWEWARWLAGRGHEVHFICQAHPSLKECDLWEGVQVVRLRGGLALPLRAWRYYWADRNAFDLVYEDPIGAGRPPFFSPIWSGVPVVAVWHQVSRRLLHELYPRPIAAVLSHIEWIVASFYRRCFLWAPSEETAQSVVSELGFEESRVHVIYPTRELSREFDAARSGGRERRHILVLGLFRRYKAFDHAIRALPAVLRDVPDVRLTVAGRRSDSGYEQEMRTLATTLGVEHHVSFVTNLNEDEKRDILASASLMVLPSLLEGYGIVTIEANEVSVPVIASSGVPVAAVEDGVNGLRYKFGDIEELSALISQCLIDDRVYAKLVKGCRTHAEGLTIEAMSPRFASLVKVALDAGTSSPFKIRRRCLDERRLSAQTPRRTEVDSPVKVQPHV